MRSTEHGALGRQKPKIPTQNPLASDLLDNLEKDSGNNLDAASNEEDNKTTPNAAPDLASRLSGRLASWTGARWAVSVVNEGGAPTIAEARDKDRIAAEDEAGTIPLVMAVMAAFPGARIIEIRTPASMAALAALDALPEADDDFDPFEDD